MEENAVTEALNKLVESGKFSREEALEFIIKTVEEFGKFLNMVIDAIPEVLKKFKTEILKLKRGLMREPWRIPIKQEIRPLYLDKRRKVHRCRNNC